MNLHLRIPASISIYMASHRLTSFGIATGFFMLIIFTGCHRIPVVHPPSCSTGQLLSLTDQEKFFGDDFDKKSLLSAVRQSVNYLERRKDDQMAILCGKSYPASWLRESMEEFLGLLQSTSLQDLPPVIAERFDVCMAINSEGHDQILATGYYQPSLEASLTRTPPYLYPLYELPPDLISTTVNSPSGEEKSVGRLENDGRLVPYWTRAEIETKGVLAGQELLYLKHPFDAFILHVQGSGLVELTNGTVRQVQFAGSNGLTYRSIGKLLVDEGHIPLEEIDLPRICAFLDEHPDEQQRILHHNERYIFFRLADAANTLNPVGSMGKTLTPGRSVALDQSCFPYGSLLFLDTTQPDIKNGEIKGWRPLRRFVLHQDSGAAIKGSGRLDLFWGNGQNAEVAAGAMKQPGRLFWLLKKENR